MFAVRKLTVELPLSVILTKVLMQCALAQHCIVWTLGADAVFTARAYCGLGSRNSVCLSVNTHAL